MFVSVSSAGALATASTGSLEGACVFGDVSICFSFTVAIVNIEINEVFVAVY